MRPASLLIAVLLLSLTGYRSSQAPAHHPLIEDGHFKLVSSEDKKPQRWVKNLSSLRLVTAGGAD